MDTLDRAAGLADPNIAKALHNQLTASCRLTEACPASGPQRWTASEPGPRWLLEPGKLSVNARLLAPGHQRAPNYLTVRSASSKPPPGEPGPPGPQTRARLYLASYVLLGITLAIYSRNALSLTAVSMLAANVVAHDQLAHLSGSLGPVASNASGASNPHNSCPLPAQPEAQGRADRQQAHSLTSSQFVAHVRAQVASGQLVDWSPADQGLIFAAGSVGNLLLAVPLTRLGELHGPKWVIFGALAGASLQAALMPLVCAYPVWLVVAFQVLFNGLAYGADCVAYTLFVRWLTPTELSLFVSCLLVCYQLGTIVSSCVTAWLLTDGVEWPWCFYVPAALCALWALVWALVGSSEPAHSWLLPRPEARFLEARAAVVVAGGGQRGPRAPGRPGVSWARLARDPNIWAIVAVKFTLRWYFSVYVCLMPTFLASVAHMSVEAIGRMSAIQALVGLLAGALMGYLTRSLVERRPFGLGLATVRKLFQSVVNFGLCLSLILFALNDCDHWLTMASLSASSVFVNFYVAGALQLPLDLSAEHCGLITSITNTLALGQALGAPLSGLMLLAGPQDRDLWRAVWALSILLNLLSGLLFIVLVDAKRRDYASPAGPTGAPAGGPAAAQ